MSAHDPKLDDVVEPIRRPKSEWREALDSDSYRVLFEEATERAGSSPLDGEKRTGTFVCAACQLPLFSSEMKFDSGTGWPSFFESIPGRLETKRDFKLVLPRTEYHCARCGGHQGHVFNDGPAPTGKRFCNNGVALRFVPRTSHPMTETGMTAPSGVELALFHDDFFDRALTRLGLPGRTGLQMAGRALAVGAAAFLPLILAAWLEGHLLWRGQTGDSGPIVPRMSMLLDVPVWTQIFFFPPFALFAELFINGRMRTAMPHLAVLGDAAELARLTGWANRLARSRWMLVLLLPAFLFPWAWARTEIANDLATWTSALAEPGSPAWFSGLLGRREWFTVAGLWVTFVSLPIFTFLWLRWLWKIGVWTVFLGRVSRLRLRLMAVHPDRTGGLGSVSDVQTSFSWILLGTSVLISGFMIYKLQFEQGNRPEQLWIPVVVYAILAPAVFLAPLFMFTAQLRATKDAARIRIQPLVLEVAETFRDHWLTREQAGAEELLHTEHTSHLADLHAAHHAVRQMRVVPFDRRSATELFALAWIPVGVLLFFTELPGKVRAFFELLS